MHVHLCLSICASIALSILSISDDLKAVAFQKAIELLSQDASPKTSPTTTTNAQRSNLPLGSAEAGVDKISRKLALSPEAVGEVYSDNEQGEVDVVVGVGKLDNSTATATKQLALLVTGAAHLESTAADPHETIPIVRTGGYGKFSE